MFGGTALAQETVPFSGTVEGPAGVLANAVVRVHRQSGDVIASATTNASGSFSTPVSKGSWRVTVTPPAGSNLALDEVYNVDLQNAMAGRFRLRHARTIEGRCHFPSGHRFRRVQIYSAGTRRSYSVPFDAEGDFGQEVAADVYSIHCSCFVGSEFWFGRFNVDVRNADAEDLDIEPARNGPVLEKSPPRASLISIGTAGPDGVADVIGAPGAVAPLSSVIVGNLDAQQVEITVSAGDGSFATRLFAPPGSAIQVKHDPTNRHLPTLSFNGTLNELGLTSGTIIHVPLPDGAKAFATGGVMNYYQSLGSFADFGIRDRFGVADPGRWWVTGDYGSNAWTPGSPLMLSGTVTFYSRNIAASVDLGAIKMHGDLELERRFDQNGAPAADAQQFLSVTMTPTGLPIERMGYCGIGARIVLDSLRYVEPDRIEGNWRLEGTIPPDLAPGLYIPRIRPTFQGIPASGRHFDHSPHVESGPGEASALPPVWIGEPVAPRLYWVLALDDLLNGQRGGIALEDRGRFQVASHVVMSSDVQILPPADPRDGRPISWRLEPFVPMMALSNARLTDPPFIPFRFPSGALTVRITRPDGTAEDLGSAPFVQSMSRMPSTRTGDTMSAATSTVSDYYQLTTLDPRFDYQFTQYGRYLVHMSGWIEDLRGNRYDGGGTYEVMVARPLDLETAILPGTPFLPGTTHSVAAVVQPPVAADVEMKVVHTPDSDPARSVTWVARGQANRFGFAPLSGTGLRMDEPGEYRIDMTARYVDRDGTLWMGSATWGNVVATPSSPLVTRGRRGFDLVGSIQQQWFLVREARAGGDHVMFPFHSGDVMWMQKDDPAADIPKITIQDTSGAFAPRVRHRRGFIEMPPMQDRIEIGEIPLFSSTPTGADPSVAPHLVDQRGYFYAFAERPGVRVREFISEDHSENGYWRFSDNYHFQLGNGIGGDLPNDFKFQFGGAVFRDDSDGFRYYGAYASLFVLLPFQDAIGGRVMPAFQGNGGGPDGGPLFDLKGEQVDLFFHLTGVRPGTILNRGQRISFAGYAAPTLPANVEIMVTSPSGVVRTMTGRANQLGYFHDPSQWLYATESGVWKARVRLMFDGRTSAGQVTEPYPTGDVLGSRDGEFYVYVADADSAQLEIESVTSAAGAVECGRLRPLSVPGDEERQQAAALQNACGAFLRPADGPITFTVEKPPGLNNVQLTYTATMPGFILEEKTQTSMKVVYDAQKLAVDFPNLDLHDFDGFAGADTITISIMLSGKDATGATRHFARQVVIQGEELQMPDQSPRPKRRAVR